MQKNIRQQMRETRQSLSIKEISQYSDDLFRQFLALRETSEKIRSFKKIGFYYAFDGEIDPISIMKYCWSEQEIKCYLPVVDRENSILKFKLYTSNTRLEKNSYQIWEPSNNEKSVSIDKLDLIFVPLTAFDSVGHRLGMGKGYYDNTLRGVTKKPYLIGLGYDFQCVEKITPHSGDVKLDAVFTDKKSFIFNFN